MNVKKKSNLLFAVIAMIAVITLLISMKYFVIIIENAIWIFTALIFFDMMIWQRINETFRTKVIFIKENEVKGYIIKHSFFL